MTFQKGQSGNPAGRPRRLKPATKLSEVLSREDGVEILETVIRAAKGGDLTACRMLLDRLYPPLRATDQPVEIDLPPNAAEAAAGVLDAVGSGVLSPSQGAALMGMVADQVRILEVTELIGRIEALERKQ